MISKIIKEEVVFYDTCEIRKVLNLPYYFFNNGNSRRRYCVNENNRLYVSEVWIKVYCAKNDLDFETFIKKEV